MGFVITAGLYTPVPGVSVGVIAGFQSNEAQMFRFSPLILVNNNGFSSFGPFEFGGGRVRWDCMGFYSALWDWKCSKLASIFGIYTV